MEVYQLNDLPEGKRFVVINCEKLPQKYVKVGYSFYDDSIVCYSTLYGGSLIHLNKWLLVRMIEN